MTFLLKSALTLSLPPAATAITILAIASLATKPKQWAFRSWLTGIALATGYAVGHRIVTGTLPLVPHSVEGWLPLSALLVAMLSALDHLPTLPTVLKTMWRLPVSVGAVAVLLLPAASLTIGAKIAWAIGLGMALTALWLAMDALAERQTGVLLPISWSTVATAGSAALFIAHTAAISQLAGVLAAVTGAAFAFGLWQRQWSWAKGAVSVVAVLLFGVTVNGVFYAELPLASATFLWLAAVAGWVRFAPISQRLPAWAQVAGQLSATIVGAGVAVGIAVLKIGLPTGGY
ncbi:hypothetical protein HRbin17_00425 [bacterium HR17]|uniref:Prepilin type IV endopeptidase peptidase domain-containing protein n=1 Tax=Candidatus Fervidibacter japonicus TaxID=2035412 RepID=A0A2H5X9R5_9BACT|nr:hypothetical protein HRbin17_00425 [bacterium HR17]